MKTFRSDSSLSLLTTRHTSTQRFDRIKNGGTPNRPESGEKQSRKGCGESSPGFYNDKRSLENGLTEGLERVVFWS